MTATLHRLPHLLVALAAAVLASAAVASTERWEPYPPGVGGPWGGSVRRLVSPGSPANPGDARWNTLFAATGGGVYHSADGGANWEARNEGLESLDVTDLGVGRSDPLRLVAATADRGLYLTSDGGLTWTRVDRSRLLVNSRPQDKFWRAAVDPTNANHLVAATFQDTTNLLESTDGGSTWKDHGAYPVSRLRFSADGTLYLGTRNGRIFRLLPGAGSPAVVHVFPTSAEVTDFSLPGEDGSVLVAAQGGAGLWRSDDGGGTWGELYFHGQPNAEFIEVDSATHDVLHPGVVRYHVNDPLSGNLTAYCEGAEGADSGLELRYRTDGNDPTASSPVYSGPLAVAADQTVTVRAFRQGQPVGPVLRKRIDVGAQHPIQVSASPGGGLLHPRCSYPYVQVSLTASTSLPAPSDVAWIYYTLDGTAPTADGTTPTAGAQRYQVPFTVAQTAASAKTVTVKYYAVSVDLVSQPGVTLYGAATPVYEEQYVFDPSGASIAASLSSGRYASAQTLSLAWEGRLQEPLPETGMEVQGGEAHPAGEWLLEGKSGLFFREGRAGPFGHRSQGLAAFTARDLAFGSLGDEVAVAGGGLGSGNGGLYTWDATSSGWLRFAGSPGDLVAAWGTDPVSQLPVSVAGALPAASTVLVRYQGQDLWAGVEGWGLYRSTDGGQTWEDRSQGLGHTAKGNVSGLEFSPSDAARAVAGTLAGVYGTSDGGLTWSAAAQIPPTTGWAVAGQDGNAQGFFAAGKEGNDGRFFRTGDAGASWTQPAPGAFAGIQLKTLAASTTAPGHVLAGSELFGLFETRDGGAAWEPLGGGTSGLPGAGKVEALALGDEPGDPWMVAVVNRSVYLTTDGGASWTERNEGLALPPASNPGLSLIYSLRFEPAAPRLVAALDGRGLWYLDLFPRAVLTGTPGSPVASRSAVLQVGGAEVVAYRSSLDGGAYSAEAPISEPLSLSGLSDGPHTVSVIGRNGAGAWQPESTATSAQWTVDATAPVGTLLVNGGAASTASRNVTLALTASDNLSGVAGMRLSNDGVTFSPWQAFAPTSAWTLSAGDGAKTVTVQFRDAAGNTATAADSIALDSALPDTEAPFGTVSIDGGAGATAAASVTLTLSASDDRGGGVEMCLANDAGPCAAWEALAASKAWNLTAGDGAKAVYARFRDAAGNVSEPVSDSIVLDATAPAGTVTIDGGAATTSAAAVTLTLAAADGAGTGVAAMRLSEDGVSWSAWEPYAASRDWTLSGDLGAKTVHAQFRDAAGNVSAPATDAIDLVAPPSSGGGGGGGGGGGCFVGSLGGGALNGLLALLALLLAALPALGAGPQGGSVASIALGSDGRTPALAATDRGLFRFSGPGWRRVEALAQRDLRAVVDAGAALVAVEAGKGLLRSVDGGETWAPVSPGPRGRYGHQAHDIAALAADPKDAAHLFLGAAGQGPFESRDAGQTWTLLLAGLEEEPPPAFHPLCLLPGAGARPLLMGTDGAGLLSWEDGRWQRRVVGLPEKLRVQALAASAKDPLHVALATRGKGLWESRDGGRTWKLLRQGAFGTVGVVSVGDDGAVLAHFPEEGLVSARGGTAGRPSKLADTRVLALTARRSGGWLAGLSHDGVLEVAAEGAPGRALNAGLDATKVSAILPLAKASGVWAGDANGVFFSSDGGATWDPSDKGLLGASANVLLARGESLLLGTGGQGVSRWVPASTSWEDRSTGLGTSNTIFALDANASGRRLYVGTEGGVFSTDDEGGRWTARNQGLPGGSFWVVAASPAAQDVVWAAGAGGVYRSPDGGGTWQLLGPAQVVALTAGTESGREVLWVLESARLLRGDGAGELREVFSAPPGERLQCVTPAAGGVWLGTSSGLWLLSGAEPHRVWSGAGVLTVRPAAGGDLLLGTDGRGVQRIKAP